MVRCGHILVTPIYIKIIDAFELWCWRRLLRVPWTARISNQSILTEISSGFSWKDWCWTWNSNTLATDAKKWLTGKDRDAGEDQRWEEKGTTEDEMVEWHHQLHGHEFEQAPGVGDGQGSLVCCSPSGHKESDTTDQLNWTDYWNNRSNLCVPSKSRSWLPKAGLPDLVNKKYCLGHTYNKKLAANLIFKFN